MAYQALVPQNILMVSETKIKNFTDIDSNVTSQVLLPFIGVVQQVHIEYLIGRPYYVELLNQISGNTLTTVNQNFLEYFLQPWVLWQAYAECLPSVWGRIKNNGIVNGAEQSISLKEMQWFTDKAIDRAQFFRERTRQEIIFNSNNYPLCYNYNSSEGLFPHIAQNYFGGVHLTNGPGAENMWASGFARAGIGYYAGPEYACIWGGC